MNLKIKMIIKFKQLISLFKSRFFNSRLCRKSFRLIYAGITPLLLILSLIYVFSFPAAVVNLEDTNPPPLLKEYDLEDGQLQRIRSAFIELWSESSNANNTSEYREPKDKISVSLTVDKLTDLDVNEGTIYASGYVDAIWGDDSFATNDPFAKSSSFNIFPSKSVRKDILSDGFFPDVVRDDLFYFEQEVLDEFEVNRYYSRYAFGGNFNFKPSLKYYPADVQNVRILFSFKTIKPFAANFSYDFAKEASMIAIDPKNLKFGVHKLLGDENVNPYLVLPEDRLIEEIVSNSSGSTSSIKETLTNITPAMLYESGINFEINKEPPWMLIGSFFYNMQSNYVIGVSIKFERVLAMFALRILLPIDLVIIGGVLNTFVPRKMSDVRLAVPPTLLLSLVFMQQSNISDLPKLTYITYIDIVYYLAYVGTMILMAESVLICVVSSDKIRASISRFCRFAVLALCVAGGKLVFPLFVSGF